MAGWEYKVLKFGASGFWGGKVDAQRVEAELNHWGAQGWEAVNATDTSWAYGLRVSWSPSSSDPARARSGAGTPPRPRPRRPRR